MDTDRVVPIRGVRFDAVTLDQAVARVVSSMSVGRGGWVVTPNLEILRRASRFPDWCDTINAADLIIADGMPIIWASKIAGCPLPERVAGSSMIEPLTKAAGQQGARLLLLGGNPGVAEQAGQLLAQRCPGVQIVGTECPPMGFESDAGYMAGLREKIVTLKPQLVYVALGSPKQEKLILAIRDCAPQAWWLGIGISLSFLTGEVRRAPSWMQRLGLEWLHRLGQEPRRLAKRYLVDGLPFAFVLLMGGALGRFRGGGSSICEPPK